MKCTNFLALFVVLLFGCLPLASAEPLRVLTSINILSQPLSEAFDRQISEGDLVITPLMKPGTDPHLYVPTRLDLSHILKADLILFIGLNLEAQFNDVLSRASKRSQVVFVGQAVPQNLLLSDTCAADQENCLSDPHIWMAPSTFKPALKAAVQAIEDQLGQTTNAQQKIDILVQKAETDVQRILNQAQITVPVITAHDAFRYYSKEFGIETLGLAGISTDIEPSVRRVSELATLIVDQQIPAIFLETSVPKRGIQALLDAAARRGTDVDILGPLYTDSLGKEKTPGDTWIRMLVSNSRTIACALGNTRLETC